MGFGGRRWVEPLALAVGALPVVVAAVAAVIGGWMPVGDAGYFTARSMDVLTGHHPLRGAWTSGSEAIGEPINNLGPLQLDLLAPFTRISPYAGTAIGTAAINLACVVGVWLTARRLFGPVGVMTAMAATLAVEAAMGGLSLVDPRQQLALLLPFWLLLWLATALWTGRSWALPAIVLVASFIVQTHLSYSYLVAGVTAASLAAWLLHHRMHPSARRPILLAAGTAVVVWVQPMWDQLFGTGNLVTALGRAGAGDRPGYSDGVRFVASGPFLPPLWLPGSIDGFSPLWSSGSLARSVLTMSVWAVVVGGLMVAAWQRQDRLTVAMGGVSLVGMVTGIHTAATIPFSTFGLSPMNYLWLWPLAVFVSVSIVAGGWRWLRAEVPGALTPARLAVGAAAVAIVACVPALRQVSHTTSETSLVEHGSPQLESMTRQIGEWASAADPLGPVLIEGWEANGSTIWIHTLRAALTDAGVDFTFVPTDVNLARYGSDRCERGEASFVLRSTTDGADLALADGEIVLARGKPLNDDASERLEELRAEVGDHLRSGDELRIDFEAVQVFNGTAHERLVELTDDPDAPASGTWLSSTVNSLIALGPIEVDRSLQGDLDQWAELEQRRVWGETVLYLAPLDVRPTGSCDDPIDAPGADATSS